MKDRILQFLTAQKISPAEFADKIGVQRSSMSHILNGRNYPSASFIQKMLQVYPLLNPRWLMIGEGAMNAGPVAETTTVVPSVPAVTEHAARIQSDLSLDDNTMAPSKSAESARVFGKERVLYEQTAPEEISAPVPEPEVQSIREVVSVGNQKEKSMDTGRPAVQPNNPYAPAPDKEIEQILFFYKDKTFTIYKPS